jgi:hypothetical protein
LEYYFFIFNCLSWSADTAALQNGQEGLILSSLLQQELQQTCPHRATTGSVATVLQMPQVRFIASTGAAAKKLKEEEAVFGCSDILPTSSILPNKNEVLVLVFTCRPCMQLSTIKRARLLPILEAPASD